MEFKVQLETYTIEHWCTIAQGNRIRHNLVFIYQPSCANCVIILPLPNMVISFPGSCFNCIISSIIFSFTILELFHTAFLSAREKTIFSAAFMPSATTGLFLIASGDDPYPAIIS